MRVDSQLSSLTEERDRLRKDVITMKKQKSGEPEGGSTDGSLIKVTEHCFYAVHWSIVESIMLSGSFS